MDGNKKVLIVDDSSLFRKYIRSILEKRYELELVDIASVREFNDYLLTCPSEEIALIILDLNLPDGNGLIALKRYKAKHGVADLPYIVVSAGVSKDVVPLALKYGARDIMAKPFKPEELISRMEKVFSGKPLHRLYQADRSVNDYQEQIHLELKRAERGSYPFSMLRLAFKLPEELDTPENYTLIIEKQFRKMMQELLRETDTALELNDNDYLFLLPFTSYENIPTVKHKIEKHVREEGQKNYNVICAVVSFPEHGKDSEQLIESLETMFRQEKSNC